MEHAAASNTLLGNGPVTCFGRLVVRLCHVGWWLRDGRSTCCGPNQLLGS